MDSAAVSVSYVQPRRLPRAVQFIAGAWSITAGCASFVAHADITSWQSALALESVGRPARFAVLTDPLEDRFVRGDFSRPIVGMEVAVPPGTSATNTGPTTRTWREVTPQKDGNFDGAPPRGGYLWLTHVAPQPRIAILEAAGHGFAYVNGEIRTGDPYGYGYVRLPVQLAAGTNDVVLGGLRGRPRAALTDPPAPVFFNPGDFTLPDLVLGRNREEVAGFVVVNATTNWVHSGQIQATAGGKTRRTTLLSIPPLGVRKVPVWLEAPAPSTPSAVPLVVTLQTSSNSTTTEIRTELRVRQPLQTRKETFLSAIDGSVQYYAVNPASDTGATDVPPALVLSLHGASVEGIGQADAYAPRPGVHLVCPTNRRPYGFDWEEWGRMDALEVLERAQASLKTDPHRVYLTGHSMGGHGTWILGATFPDRFAAIAPSAGWISFSSYGGGRTNTGSTNAIEALLRRAAASGDTLAMATNFLSQGVYVLHGDADDNVPVREARTMRTHLGGFHPDVRWHERTGAGHWWDGPQGGGADCVDWPPIFELFNERRLPDTADAGEPTVVHFTTVNPGVSSRAFWVTVLAQELSLQPSDVHLVKDRANRRITGTTRNVSRLRLRFASAEAAAFDALEIDGQKVPIMVSIGASPRPFISPNGMEFVRAEGRWTYATHAQSPQEKNPLRAGPFKEAFQHRMVLVYGTRGTPAENAWSLARARYDGEAFWYRGNGAVEIVADNDFDPRRDPQRSVILYGHRDSNAAWKHLLPQSPIEISRGLLRIGTREFRGDDLACTFLQPRVGDASACVAVVGGTGLTGLRVTHRLPYFTSGAGFPDCLAVDTSMYEKGLAGVVAAGFFGPDWSVERGEFAWR